MQANVNRKGEIPLPRINVIEKFIKLPHDKKAKMGLLARKKMEQEYDRRLVIDAYLEQIGI